MTLGATPARTLLLVPASRIDAGAAGPGPAADALVFDFDGAFGPGEAEAQIADVQRGALREQTRAAVGRAASTGRQVWVRVHTTYSGLAKEDVRSVVQTGLAGILLPRADSPEIVRYCDALLRDAERMAGIEPGSLRVIAQIESARAVLHVAEIARASARLSALAFGAERFAADMRVDQTAAGEGFAYARGAIAVAARAYDLKAVDRAFPILHDPAALVRDAETARRLGFGGKLLVDPEQIEPVAAVFGGQAPSAAAP